MVLAYLHAPKLGVCGWDGLAGATMPKASVNKERHFASRPSEIRFAWDGPVFSIASHVRGPEKLSHGDLRAKVSL